MASLARAANDSVERNARVSSAAAEICARTSKAPDPKHAADDDPEEREWRERIASIKAELARREEREWAEKIEQARTLATREEREMAWAEERLKAEADRKSEQERIEREREEEREWAAKVEQARAEIAREERQKKALIPPSEHPRVEQVESDSREEEEWAAMIVAARARAANDTRGPDSRTAPVKTPAPKALDPEEAQRISRARRRARGFTPRPPSELARGPTSSAPPPPPSSAHAKSNLASVPPPLTPRGDVRATETESIVAMTSSSRPKLSIPPPPPPSEPRMSFAQRCSTLAQRLLSPLAPTRPRGDEDL